MGDKAAQLAALLLAARRSGRRIEHLPDLLHPENDGEAYAVQALLQRELGRVAGWKVGATGPAAEPNAAPLFADRIFASPAQLPAADFPLRGIECELAFRFAKPLPIRATAYGEDEVWDAVATLHPAIEIVESRFADFRTMPKHALLADNQSNGALCYGPAVAAWREVDFLRQPASLAIDGREIASATGGNAAGHPRRLLCWLANHCVKFGRAIETGDIVTTGTHTGLAFAGGDAEVIARFAGLGDARLSFAAAAV